MAKKKNILLSLILVFMFLLCGVFAVKYSKNTKADTTAPLYSVGLYHESWGQTNREQVILTFYNGQNVAIYNTPFDATTINTLYNAVKNKIKINGVDLETINATESGLVSIFNVGATNKLGLSIANTVLKYDGTDVFTFEKGISFPTGATTQVTWNEQMYEATISGTDYQSGCKFKAVAIANGEIAPFRQFVLWHNGWGTGIDTLVIIFNDGNKDIPIFDSGMSTKDIMSIVGDKIKINGVALCDTGLEIVDIDNNAKIAMHISQTSSVLKRDGTDTIEIDKDLILPNGLKINKGVCQILYDYVGGDGTNSSSAFKDYVIPTGEIVPFRKFVLYHNSYVNGYDTLVIIFNDGNNDISIFEEGTSMSDVMSIVGEKIKINDVALCDTGLQLVDIGFTSKIAMHISQSSSVLKRDGTDTFEIAEDLILPNGSRINKGVNQVMTTYVSGTGTNSSSVFENESELSPRWNTTKMFAKKVNVVDGVTGNYVNNYGTTKAIFYDGEMYKGNQTTCFAYIGIPSSAMPEGGYPAIVLVHGAGGCAFYEWVEYWNSKGYVAIAPDFYGQQYGSKSYDGKGAPKNPNGGPTESGSISSTKETFYDSWTYHSVSNIIYANNILRQMDEVNSDKIGITGISWGSVLTCITAGVDTRFNAYAPVYGGGYLLNTPGVYTNMSYQQPTDTESWLELFDPSSYLVNCTKPILFTMGANDSFFSIKNNALSAKLCKGDVYYSQRSDLSHYHRWKDEEGMSNVYRFMNYILCGESLPYEIVSSSVDSSTLSFEVNDYTKIKSAKLNYTFSTERDTRKWTWNSIDVELTGNINSASIPAGTKACFIQFSDGETIEYVASTEVFILDTTDVINETLNATLDSISLYHDCWNQTDREQLILTFYNGQNVAIYNTPFDATTINTLYNAVKNKIKINGVDLETINATESGLVSIFNVGATNKLGISIANSVLKYDGTDVFTIEEGIVFPTVVLNIKDVVTVNSTAKTTITISKVMYYVDIPQSAGATGCKFKTTVMPTEDKVPFYKFILYHNSFISGYDTLVIIFNDGTNDIPVLVDGMTNKDIMDIVGDKIKINGVKLCDTGLEIVDISNPAKIALHISQSSSILKRDGTDVVVIDSDLVLPNGSKINEGVSQNLYEYIGGEGKNSSSKFCEYHELTGKKVNITECSIFANGVGNGNDMIYITFDDEVSATHNREITPDILANIRINGYTLKDIRDLIGNLYVDWNPNSGRNQLLIYIPRDREISLKFDNKDRIEILANMKTLNGSVVENGYDIIYYNTKIVDTSSLVNNHSVSNCEENSNNVIFYLSFYLGNKKDEQSVDLSKILLNNNEIDNSVVDASWSVIDNISYLVVKIDKTSMVNDLNKITILSGFEISNSLTTTCDVDLVYYPDYTYWIDENENIFANENIKVVSINNPKVIRDGSLMIEINFNKVLTDERLQDYNTSFDNLLEGTNSQKPGYYYTQELIANLVKYDIPHSTIENIIINGKTLAEISKEYSVTVGMYEKQIYILIAPNSLNKLYANTSDNIELKILAGVRSYFGGSTKEDLLYTYVAKDTNWIIGEYIAPSEEPTEEDSTKEDSTQKDEEPTSGGNSCFSSISCSSISLLFIALSFCFVVKKKIEKIEKK